jgi:hypothetical protein
MVYDQYRQLAIMSFLTERSIKALWNISVPYIARRRAEKNPADGSVNLEIEMDILCLCWTLLFVLLTDDAYLFCSKGCMVLLCLLLPMGSLGGLYFYGLLFERKRNLKK